MNPFFRLMRPQQWYKNFVAFIAIVFVGGLFQTDALTKTVLAFVSVCFISSTNYVINDIIDVEKDRAHPEKRNRPIPSGKVKISQAWFLAAILFVFSLVISFTINQFVVFGVAALFFSTLAYSLFFKEIPFLDVIVIAINFVVRAVVGALAIMVPISPWLVLCSFLLALLLAFSKRKADLLFLGENAAKHKKVLEVYTKSLLDGFIMSVSSMLLLSYSIYCFLSPVPHSYIIMATIPVASFLVFRYVYLVESGNEIARHPERVWKDREIVTGIAVWTLLILIVMYR